MIIPPNSQIATPIGGFNYATTTDVPTPRTLIVGLGKTGLSCARFLARRGIEFSITDTRNVPPGFETLRSELPRIPLHLGGFRTEVFNAAEQIILSPGVAVADPFVQSAIKRGVPVIGDIELFAQFLPIVAGDNKAQTIAVTGSNGKSTVVSLLGAMATNAGIANVIGGNFGEPALNLLAPSIQLYVLELSSFQLETTYNLTPIASAALNVSPDHMDRYPNVELYAQAKARIYSGATVRVFNRDDPLVATMLNSTSHNVSFGLNPPSTHDFGLIDQANQTWIAQGTETLLPTTALRIPGRHNLSNALAALALGNAAGLPMSKMLETLTNYTGLAHRTQLIVTRNGVRWYNDSKGTNVGATRAALEGLHPQHGNGRALLIAGGDGKGADFSPLAPVVARTCRAVILIGRDAPILEQALNGYATLLRAANLAEAVQVADEVAKTDDYVLLSPACASFDMFRNYEHRGEIFNELVRQMANKNV